MSLHTLRTISSGRVVPELGAFQVMPDLNTGQEADLKSGLYVGGREGGPGYAQPHSGGPKDLT